jgi:hypothetical protein
MASVDTHGSSAPGNVRCGRLPRSRNSWPAEALDAHRDLLRRLDTACRNRGLPPAGNEWIADEAVRQVWEKDAAPFSPPHAPSMEARGSLPLELRRWPATWRYRVADLEKSGRSRESAVRVARAEHERHLAAQRTGAQQAA